jgi:fatty acid desaturase
VTARATPDAPIDGVAQALVRDRQRVRDALRALGLGIADFQEIDPLRAVRYLGTVWLATALAAWAWLALPGAWALLLVPVIGVIQHAMLNVVHEASHHLLLRDRRRNELVANLLAALPIGHTVASYRITHLDHHTYLRRPEDPSSYVTGPQLTAREIRRTLAFLLLGRLTWELAARALLGRRFEAGAAADRQALQATDRRRLLAVAAWHGVALALCWPTGLAGFWVTWLVTVMTVTPTLDGIRTLVEHRRAPGDAGAFHTRSHHRSPVVSGLMAPFFQYHWEHHLFPAVPHHELARLHRILVGQQVAGARPREGFFASLARVVQEH